jgi:phospholipid/cholesterol/gamma-HCH transport system ATP-binding protein
MHAAASNLVPHQAQAAPPPPRTAGEPIIRVEGFCAAYEGKTVLSDITFDVRRGEVLVIAGGSGSGKSTLLKHMIGLCRPAGGRILIEGGDLASASPHERERILRLFGVSFQGGALFGSMTVLDNIRLPLQEYTALPSNLIDMIALAKLRLVGLADAAQKLPSELSGGMIKRVAIARAMALDSSIVFLDEPSAGLDPITAAELDQLILTLNRLLKTTFVVVTHELPSIFAIADRVVMLDATVKRMVALDTPQRLRDECPNLWVRSFMTRQPPRRERDSP